MQTSPTTALCGAHGWILYFMETQLRPPEDKIINLVVHKGRCGGDEKWLRGLLGVTQESGIKLGRVQ